MREISFSSWLGDELNVLYTMLLFYMMIIISRLNETSSVSGLFFISIFACVFHNAVRESFTPFRGKESDTQRSDVAC